MQPSSSLVSTSPDLRNDFDYDLTNRRKLLIVPPAGSVTDLHDEHSYLETEAQFDGQPGSGAPLAAGTPGVDDGLGLPGLNDGFVGAGPDRGAVERDGQPWTVGPEAAVLVGPVAVGSLIVENTSGTALALEGDASKSTHDPKGWIRTYSWRLGDEEVGSGRIASFQVPHGTQQVTLRVVDNEDVSDEVAIPVGGSAGSDSGTAGSGGDAGSGGSAGAVGDAGADGPSGSAGSTSDGATASNTGDDSGGCSCRQAPSRSGLSGLLVALGALVVGLGRQRPLRRGHSAFRLDEGGEEEPAQGPMRSGF